MTKQSAIESLTSTLDRLKLNGSTELVPEDLKTIESLIAEHRAADSESQLQARLDTLETGLNKIVEQEKTLGDVPVGFWMCNVAKLALAESKRIADNPPPPGESCGWVAKPSIEDGIPISNGGCERGRWLEHDSPNIGAMRDHGVCPNCRGTGRPVPISISAHTRGELEQLEKACNAASGFPIDRLGSDERRKCQEEVGEFVNLIRWLIHQVRLHAETDDYLLQLQEAAGHVVRRIRDMRAFVDHTGHPKFKAALDGDVDRLASLAATMPKGPDERMWVPPWATAKDAAEVRRIHECDRFNEIDEEFSGDGERLAKLIVRVTTPPSLRGVTAE